MRTVATCDDLMQILRDKLFCHRSVWECDHVHVSRQRQLFCACLKKQSTCFGSTVIKYWTCSFSILDYVSENSRYERYFTEKRCWVEQTASDTARQRVWEQRNLANLKRCWMVFVSRAVQKFILVSCDWWFSISIFCSWENFAWRMK